MTTADLYRAPPDWSATTRPTTPAVLCGFTEGERVAREFWAVFQTTEDEERRSRLLRELGELSIQPDSLDRDSDIDIWGFHSGT